MIWWSGAVLKMLRGRFRGKTYDSWQEGLLQIFINMDL